MVWEMNYSLSSSSSSFPLFLPSSLLFSSLPPSSVCQGFCLGPESNCQLAWCLTKVEKKAAAMELFSTVITCFQFSIHPSLYKSYSPIHTFLLIPHSSIHFPMLPFSHTPIPHTLILPYRPGTGPGSLCSRPHGHVRQTPHKHQETGKVSSYIQSPMIVFHEERERVCVCVRLSSSLVAASDSHSECWVAKAWYQTRNAALSSLERSRASVLLENVSHCVSGWINICYDRDCLGGCVLGIFVLFEKCRGRLLSW